VLNTVRCFLPPLSHPDLSRVAATMVDPGSRRLRQVEAGVTPVSFFRLASFRGCGETLAVFLACWSVRPQWVRIESYCGEFQMQRVLRTTSGSSRHPRLRRVCGLT